MRLETKIATLLMLAALALSSCTKKTITPAEDPQPAEVGFTAASQAVWVKGGDEIPQTPQFSDLYDRFGVWGIARSIYSDLIYNLWDTNVLTQVLENEETGLYEPVTVAYWISGYQYNFLALAPYDIENPAPEFGTSVPRVTAASDNNADQLTFTYDLTSKYNPSNPDYTYDLLGAGIKTTRMSGSGTNTQGLKFWHLFSQISVDVKFAEGITGRVDKISFSPIPSGTFYISSVGEDPDVIPSVTCTPIYPSDQSVKPVINFEDLYDDDADIIASAGPINIVPQRASDLTLIVDFTIADEETGPVAYKGMIINLNAPGVLERYEANGKYKYIVTIGTSASISFTVAVNDWDREDDQIIDIE